MLRTVCLFIASVSVRSPRKLDIHIKKTVFTGSKHPKHNQLGFENKITGYNSILQVFKILKGMEAKQPFCFHNQLKSLWDILMQQT